MQFQEKLEVLGCQVPQEDQTIIGVCYSFVICIQSYLQAVVSKCFDSSDWGSK